MNTNNSKRAIIIANYGILREWCLTILDFLQTGFPQMNIFTISLKEAINDIDKKGSTKYMRAMYREINELVGVDMLPPKELEQLNDLLSNKFGHNIRDELDRDVSKINNIIKRGHIRNDREYELVKRREDEIYADESQKELMLKLQQLMLDYEK